MPRLTLPAIWGAGALTADIPERVRASIARQQDASERLIAWTQLGVIVTFGVLYALSPKTSTVVPWMTPVGLALMIYFVFSVFRVWLSYRIRLPGWFLSLSVAADLTLLMTVIWSFHIQYDQPASFYLKAPTFMYVFHVCVYFYRVARPAVRSTLCRPGRAGVGRRLDDAGRLCGLGRCPGQYDYP
jgi:adenylate cyclase